jgi:hypothetical protein
MTDMPSLTELMLAEEAPLHGEFLPVARARRAPPAHKTLAHLGPTDCRFICGEDSEGRSLFCCEEISNEGLFGDPGKHPLCQKHFKAATVKTQKISQGYCSYLK